MARLTLEQLQLERFPHTLEIPVLYGDLDTNRHVNNVSMGRFFEHARFSTTPDIIGERIFFLVARVAIDYLAEAHLGAPLRVGTRLAGKGRTSLTLEQVAWQRDLPVASCETVLVHLVDGRPSPLPEL